MSNTSPTAAIPVATIDNATPTETPTARPKGLSSAEIGIQVAESIVGAAPRVLSNVVKILTDKEVERRATLLLGGLELATQTKRDLSKAEQPDVRPALFTANGAPIGEAGWSKPRLAEIKKLKEKLVKIDKAIDAATRELSPDFSLLSNLKADIEKAEKAAAEPTES